MNSNITISIKDFCDRYRASLLREMQIHYDLKDLERHAVSEMGEEWFIANSPKEFTWIYFAEAAEQNLIKIGRTKNIPQRLKALSRATPMGSVGPLKLIGRLYAWPKSERLFHSYFWPELRFGKEWFQDTPRVRSFAERFSDA